MIKRAWPPTVLAIGLIASAAWIGLLGYELFKLGRGYFRMNGPSVGRISASAEGNAAKFRVVSQFKIPWLTHFGSPGLIGAALVVRGSR
jgi:hypothetical protein